MPVNLKIREGNGIRISPFIYGNFMEFLDDHISAMWAEMLVNRKFDDFDEEAKTFLGWYSDGLRNESEYLPDTNTYVGRVCPRLHCMAERSGDTAISQKGVSVRKGRKYLGYAYLRQSGLNSAITVAVGRKYGSFFLPYASQVIKNVGHCWAKHSFALDPGVDDDDAEFTIRFAGTGELWTDAVSLMPDDNVQGWRSDIVKLIQKLKPNIIRFPGGGYADTYHWEDAIGDRDLRGPTVNRCWNDVPADYMRSNCQAAANERKSEPNDVGTDEFAALCRATGTEGLICVNLGTGTAAEAASWVEYCNGNPATEYGMKRALNGNPAPYSIRYWEIGNEMYGDWEFGYVGLSGYIEGYKRFHTLMTTACSGLKFIADGYDQEWNRAILLALGDIMDYLDIHIYPGIRTKASETCSCRIFEEMLEQVNFARSEIGRVRGEIRESGLEGRVRIAVCEWNITGLNWGPDRIFLATHGNALFCACLVALFQKNADIVGICNFSNLTNTWWASCIHADKSRSHASAQFHVLSMYSNHSGDILLETESTGDSAASGMEYAASRGDGFLSVALVNGTGKAAEVRLDLSSIIDGENRNAEIFSLSASSPEHLNDFTFPGRVVPAIRSIRVPGIIDIMLKPFTFEIIRIDDHTHVLKFIKINL